MAKKNKGSRVKEILSTSRDAEGEITSLWQTLQEKPWHYGIGTAVIIAAILFTVGYQQHTASSARELYTTYARALEAEEPAEQAKQLEAAIAAGALSPETLYMMGESALKAGEHEKAKSAFERLRQEYPDSRFLPDAVEAGGFMAEEAEDYDGALKAYNEIIEKWPQSFAARRQPLNIGRVHEARGDLAAAVQAYQDQTGQFPGSGVAQEADMALARLRESNPDLFPEEVPETEAAVPASEPAPGTAESPAAEPPASAPAEAGAEELPDVSTAPKLTIPDASDEGEAESADPALPPSEAAPAATPQPGTEQ
jgi:TolA-binding protein